MLLKQLCETHGVSGNEGAVRELIIEHIRPYVTDITVDSMGNLIAYKKGSASTANIMVAAHMDEVGFIVSDITDKGYLKFKTVGGIDPRVIVGKKVLVGAEKVTGIIAYKAIHLQTKAERGTAVLADKLCIDIGVKDKEQAQSMVKLGDYAAFDTAYGEFGDGRIKAKALDDRCGCYALIESLKKEYKNDVYACFTVQEEVGCRGAGVVARRIRPDIALVVDSTTCADVGSVDKHLEVTTLGSGPAIYIMDAGSYSHIGLTHLLVRLAEKHNIPYQFKRSAMGGNDARSIQTANDGVATVSFSVPCRYLHSPVGVVAKTDVLAACGLVCTFLDSAGGYAKEEGIWNY